jgi:protein SCO1/2
MPGTTISQGTKVQAFSFLNQDSSWVTNDSLKGKVVVADFIFLNCTTICPRMTSNMLKVYRHFESSGQVSFISHTIDPENDSVPQLRSYAQSIGVSAPKWQFVYGDTGTVYKLARESYYSTAGYDLSEPGGYIHSGGLILVDQAGFVRGVYDGTDSTMTQLLISDITNLLKKN